MNINTIKNALFEFRYNLKHKDVPKTTFSDYEEYVGETISLKKAKELWLPEYNGFRKNQDKNDSLYGAMFGDMVGSRYEFSKYPKDYETMELLDDNSFYTDDTILSIATKYAIENNIGYDDAYHKIGNIFKYAGYGPGFSYWLSLENYKPYYSYGNGSAMRISPIGAYFQDKMEMFKNAYDSAVATHNHREGIKGAIVAASCIWILYQNGTKEDVYQYAKKCYPEIDQYKIDKIRHQEIVSVDCLTNTHRQACGVA